MVADTYCTWRTKAKQQGQYEWLKEQLADEAKCEVGQVSSPPSV